MKRAVPTNVERQTRDDWASYYGNNELLSACSCIITYPRPTKPTVTVTALATVTLMKTKEEMLTVLVTEVCGKHEIMKVTHVIDVDATTTETETAFVTTTTGEVIMVTATATTTLDATSTAVDYETATVTLSVDDVTTVGFETFTTVTVSSTQTASTTVTTTTTFPITTATSFTTHTTTVTSDVVTTITSCPDMQSVTGMPEGGTVIDVVLDTDALGCCMLCFNQQGCDVWFFLEDVGTCVTTGESHGTTQCPMGIQEIVVGISLLDGVPFTFGPGPCARSLIIETQP